MLLKTIWIMFLFYFFSCTLSIWTCPATNCWKVRKTCSCLKMAFKRDVIRDVNDSYSRKLRSQTALRWRPVAVLFPDKSRAMYDYSCYHNDGAFGCDWQGRVEYKGNSKIPVMLGITKADVFNSTKMYNWETAEYADGINVFPMGVQFILCNTSETTDVPIYKNINFSIINFNLSHRREFRDFGIGRPDKDVIIYQLSAVTDRYCQSHFEIFTDIFLNISIKDVGKLASWPVTLEEGYAFEYMSVHKAFPWGRPRAKPYNFRCTKEHPCKGQDYGDNRGCCKGCCNVKNASDYPIGLIV